MSTTTKKSYTERVALAAYTIYKADCLRWMREQPKDSFDLVIGSPPYAEKGERYQGKSKRWKTAEWIEWMLKVTNAAVRISKGRVLWVVNGAVRKGEYLPAVEGLLYEWWKMGRTLDRPCIWYKNAPPNRRDWFGNDWEFVVCFTKRDAVHHFDWEAIATSYKYSAGGRFRQRDSKGNRKLGNEYPQNKVARPRDVIRATVGGGHLGHPLAHENEAPFPESLIEPFVLTLCPPGGLILDPFCGSGTTIAVALRHGRRAIGLDVRESQVKLAERRIQQEIFQNSS